MDTRTPPQGAGDARRRANVRTAIVLLSIAMMFFAGVIAAKFLGGYEVGMSVVGVAVLLFLLVAIGRNVRGGR